MHKRQMTVFGRQQLPKSWYSFKPVAQDVAEIFIYDEISFWGVDAGAFNRELAELDVDRINLRINSPGGSVFDGIAIFNALRRHRAGVDVTVDGIAASISSVIALAGDTVTMSEGSWFMIHDPWALAIGNAADLRETADVLDKIGGEMADIYARHSDLNADEVREAMLAETWYTASEAVEAGFATAAAGEVSEAAARFDLSIYSNVPDEASSLVRRKPEPPKDSREFEKLMRDAGFSANDAKRITGHGFASDSLERDAGQNEPENDELGEVLDALNTFQHL